MNENNIPPEHRIQCSTCDQFFDARDLAQVMAHGQYNEETGKYECKEPGDVQYGSSRKVGDPTEWTKDGKKIDLN
jgi:hypothetical protein